MSPSEMSEGAGPAPAGAAVNLAERVRPRFPAIRAAGDETIFFDNAAGAQVPDDVVEATREHLLERNVQRGGRYDRSIAVDRLIQETRSAFAAFLGARGPQEIMFGLNGSNLTRMVADASRPLFQPGDEVVVTELDHESNIGPWLRLADSGVTPRFWRVRNPGARLLLDDLRALLASGKVRLVALPYASNATGRIVDVVGAARLARAAGALTFVDAVHFGPHGPIDSEALEVDFLVFSGYKIFGPHLGVLWGRSEALERLNPAREFFIPAEAPYAFEAGTQNFEGIAAMAGALRYLASLGEGGSIRAGMEAVRAYERELAQALLRELARMGGLRVFGDDDPGRVADRVPTVSFTIAGIEPRRIVESLAASGIQARDGHMYSPRLLEACGIDVKSGVARVSLCHYNTREEIERLGKALRALSR